MNSENYYNGLDELPLTNWIKCTNGDLKSVRKDKNNGNNDLDNIIWEKIFDEYLVLYGLNKEYKKLLMILHQKTLLELEFCITGDKFKITEIEIESAKYINLVSNKGSGVTIEKTLIYLSRWMKYHIDAKNITTGYYFELMSEYEKNSKI